MRKSSETSAFFYRQTVFLSLGFGSHYLAGFAMFKFYFIVNEVEEKIYEFYSG